ncbi:DUF4189 domain-containing protein [Oryzibacter oryziterrae]|uniref:DUF4189 domain-containing protein n=1 Tax=Oryzibacter oryziterrae TaxID=2766474 RepID=UPI001F37635D|nr:DUF4189 domain-containing protein [Oryzibacter oryziterrae]
MRRSLIASLAALTLLLPQAALANGAIAIDDNVATDGEAVTANDVGYGTGFGDSKSAAEADAVKNCQDAGNTSCRVVVSFKACGAYAVSTNSGKRGKGIGDTEDAAKAAAIKDCGESRCTVAVSDCDN